MRRERVPIVCTMMSISSYFIEQHDDFVSVSYGIICTLLALTNKTRENSFVRSPFGAVGVRQTVNALFYFVLGGLSSLVFVG